MLAFDFPAEGPSLLRINKLWEHFQRDFSTQSFHPKYLIATDDDERTAEGKKKRSKTDQLILTINQQQKEGKEREIKGRIEEKIWKEKGEKEVKRKKIREVEKERRSEVKEGKGRREG